LATLVFSLVDALNQCEKVIQEKTVWHFSQCDDKFGRRVAQGIGLDYETAKA
jgi:catalase